MTEPQTIACQVRRIIAKRLGVDPSQLHDHTTLYILGVDDITKIEIGLDLEDHFGAEAPDEMHEACKSIGDLVRLAESLAAEPVS